MLNKTKSLKILHNSILNVLHNRIVNPIVLVRVTLVMILETSPIPSHPPSQQVGRASQTDATPSPGTCMYGLFQHVRRIMLPEIWSKRNWQCSWNWMQHRHWCNDDLVGWCNNTRASLWTSRQLVDLAWKVVARSAGLFVHPIEFAEHV